MPSARGPASHSVNHHGFLLIFDDVHLHKDLLRLLLLLALVLLLLLREGQVDGQLMVLLSHLSPSAEDVIVESFALLVYKRLRLVCVRPHFLRAAIHSTSSADMVGRVLHVCARDVFLP